AATRRPTRFPYTTLFRSGMLGVGLDELVQRESARRHRRLGYLAAACLAGMAVTSTLAITAIRARDAARDQRREIAETAVSASALDRKSTRLNSSHSQISY